LIRAPVTDIASGFGQGRRPGFHTVPYLGIEVEDASELAEGMEA